MLKNLFNKIIIFLDTLKDMLISLGIKLLLLLIICVVIHNVLKIGEISPDYIADYKKLYPVYENKMMNIYQAGSGEKTVVILSGFGAQAPIVQYKNLIEGLKDNYRVVVIEYFGYGFSMGITEERTNQNITYEIKTALDAAGISGKYILMPHSLSNVYAMYFSEAYPDSVQAIISIDGTFPNEIKDKYYQSKLRDNIRNIRITSVFELTGFERALSYLKEDVFYIDKMKQNTDVFTINDIKVYRNRIGSNYLSRTMIREIKKTEENMQEMKDYKYPNELPVLEILASDTVEQYSQDKKNGAEKDLLQLANEPITNNDIQRVITIKGDNMLQLSNHTELLNQIKLFLESF